MASRLSGSTTLSESRVSYYLAPGPTKAFLQARPFPPVLREADRRNHAGKGLRRFKNVVPRIVRASVVDHEDFEAAARVVCLQHRIDRLLDHLAFVVCGNDYGEGRRVSVV